RGEALGRFVAAARGHLSEADLVPAEALIERAGKRLSLSRAHTVVALAGSTGTGKSTVFNLLAGLDLSRTGARRPTTDEAHACVWGEDSADGLLDWLGVRRRFQRAAEPQLSGLVLLDLPDFDSVRQSHRVEADRLLSVVDLIVWVLNPQKYADKVVHKSYLARFHRHREITVVLFNQVDLLSSVDLQECVSDLRQLLKKDGLEDVPVLTSSALGPPGLDALTGALSKVVAARQAALRRLSADLDEVTAGLEPLMGEAGRMDGFGRRTRDALTDALARAAGVPVVADATEKAYVHRARKVTGWPLLRWLRRLRPDPLSRLHLENPAAATSIGPAAPAAQAAVALGVRDAASRVGESLPGPWQESVLRAMRSKMDDLPDALDRAVAQTDLGLARRRLWWRAVGALQWVAVAAAVAGLAWLAVRYVMFALALPEPPLPTLGRIPWPTALLVGGLLGGLLLSMLVRPVVRFAARRQRRRVQARLRVGVAAVAAEYVVAPAERVLHAYAMARDALREARG
ncbi:GTPase, partial [Allorhizocola rhizosphaerae]|uniref:GTPase n=1 Tax=Allorhizocola rhizosphaerae TaxID=1872709 RepID=UPI000E3B77F8